MTLKSLFQIDFSGGPPESVDSLDRGISLFAAAEEEAPGGGGGQRRRRGLKVFVAVLEEAVPRFREEMEEMPWQRMSTEVAAVRVGGTGA